MSTSWEKNEISSESQNSPQNIELDVNADIAATCASASVDAPKPPTDTSKVSATTCIGRGGGNRKAFPMWNHFTRFPCQNKKEQKSKCNYCAKVLAYAAVNGTSSMNNHLKRCQQYPFNVDKKQKTLSFQTKQEASDGGSIKNTLTSWTFDKEKSRKAFAKMVVAAELPMKFVEHEAFKDFCNEIQPRLVIPSRHTVGRDCYNHFLEKKKKLKKCLSNIKRVCITINTWTSIQNFSYMCLTVHFIDNHWRLHKKILNFCPIPGHSGEIIRKGIESCLLNWRISKVLTVTVDNASSNDVGVAYLRRRLNNWEGTMLKGEFLHMRCAAHILNLIVKDGLTEVEDSIYRIRSAIKYVRSSPSRLQKFKTCIEKERIESDSLVCLDVETRRNSTYLMLESALKFQKAFELLEIEDNEYRKELLPSESEIASGSKKGLPSQSDWDYVKDLLPFLQIFYDATLSLFGSIYVTSNEYMKIIFGLGIVLKVKCNAGDIGVRMMAAKMKIKFDKYWGNINNINYLLFIATILDPRCKLGYVNFLISEVYEMEKANEMLGKVNKTLEDLCDYYNCTLPSTESHKSVVDVGNVVDVGSSLKINVIANSLYKRLKVDKGIVESKNELEKHFGEECADEDDTSFDVLEWWKLNSSRYKVLSCIARDVLAIHVSTVAFESAFGTGGRVLDSFRSSLSPRMVEALICAQYWLRRSHDTINIEKHIHESESIESDTMVTDDHQALTIDED